MAHTVIVVGAGASVEFGLPTGRELNLLVAANLTSKPNDWNEFHWADAVLDQAFRAWPEIGATELMRGSEKIARGIPYSSSVDDFLFIHGADDRALVAAGKAAIVSSILFKERKSPLAKLGEHDRAAADAVLAKFADAWPLQLLRNLMPGVRVEQIGDLFSDVAFVNFNYDRCLEHLLFHALQRTHSLDQTRAADVINRMRIVHPYGKVGHLPWENKRPSLAFGAAYYPDTVIELAGGINTLTEAHHTEEERDELAQLMSDARRVVFLGFGFHRQNVQLLAPIPDINRGWKPKIFGTAYRASPSELRVYRRLLDSLWMGGVDPEFADLDCKGMLTSFGREMAS